MKYLKLFENFLIQEEAGLLGYFKINQDCKSILNDIYNIFNDNVAKSILELEGSEQSITYLSLTDKENTIYYADVSRIKYFFEQIGNATDDVNSLIKMYSLKPINEKTPHIVVNGCKLPFIEIVIGRLAKKLLLDKHSDDEIQKFAERWTSQITGGEFEIWERDRILEAYDSKNHQKRRGTQLYQSCMNDENYVLFYTQCPTLKILVLTDNGKIKGRCLIWEDYKGRKIMDRVYYNSEFDYQKFYKWGLDNDYYIRLNNTGNIDIFIKDGKQIILNTKVEFPDSKKMGPTPYVDTFAYWQDGWGMNYRPETPGHYYFLQETDGTCERFYNIDPKQRNMDNGQDW